MTRTRPRTTLALLGLIAGMAMLIMPAIASAEVPADDVPPALESAIKTYIEGQGHEYAGFCREIDQSANAGKHCAFVLSLTDTEAEVTHGAVASDEVNEVRFQKQGDAWSVSTDGATDDIPSADVPDELEAAIKAYIEAQGHDYAGFCREIDQSANAGKHCAFVLSLTDTEAEVTYGAVASDEVNEVRFQKQGGTWSAATGGPSGDIPSADVPDDLEAAIKAYIEAQGHDYAGFCREIDQSANIGKHCIFVLSLDDTEAKITHGPVASDDLSEVTFVKEGGVWKASTASGTPTATPPKTVNPTPAAPETGSDGIRDGSGDDVVTVVVVGALIALVAFGGGASIRRR